MKRAIKYLLIATVGILNPYGLYAQSVVFNKVYNDYSYSKTDSNSNQTFYNNDYLTTIFEFSPNIYTFYGHSRNHDYFLWEDSLLSYNYIVNTDEFGDTILTNKLNFNSDKLEAFFGGILSNNNEYIIGVVNDNINNIYEENNSVFIKLNQNRDTIFRKEFDYGEDTEFVTIKIKNNGQTFQVLGFADLDTGGINYDAFISTIDSSGNLVSNIQLGGIENDFLYGLEYLYNGNYLVCGHTFSFGVAGSDIWLMEVAPNGTVLWQKFYGGQYYERIWNSRGMLVKDNFIYLAGTGIGEYSINGVLEPTGAGWVLKLDMQGNEIWNKKYVRGLGIDFFKGIQEWDTETLILGGEIQDYTVGDVAPRGWIMKIDTSGNTLWERTIAKYKASDNNGNDPQHYVDDVLVTQDKGILLGGYIIANYITDINGYFHRNDAWLAKTDSCGFTVGDVPEPMLLIDSIYNKTVYISEQSQNYCSGYIDWGHGSAHFLSAYENNQPLTHKSISHTYSEIDNYTIRTTTIAGEEARDFEVQVLGLNTSLLATKVGNLSLFPNPANDYVIVQNSYSFLQRKEGVFKMHIFDLNGKQVKSINLNAKLYQQKLDVSSLNNGVYLMKFEMNGELVETEKFVVAK